MKDLRRSLAVGSALGFVPFIWALTAGRLTLTRTARPDGLFSNIFDLQARALLHGRFDLDLGSLAIESFNIGGRTYTYFPPFPALLRMPVLAITDRWFAKLTAVSMVGAWLVTMAATAAVLSMTWGARHRGRRLSRPEQVAVAAFMTAVGGGSLLVYLAGAPWVYHEVYAWSIALAMLAMLCTLRYLDEPSARRSVDLGAAVTALILTRTTVGAGGVLMALGAGLVVALRRDPRHDRRAWRGAAAAAGFAVAAACAVTWVKFGSPFRFLPLDQQVWTQVNAHRRAALAANGGGLTNISFMPTTAGAYLSPFNVRVRPYFPYITLPATPPSLVGSPVFDQLYRTGSVTAFMPLFVVLSGVGAVVTVRHARRRSWTYAVPLLGLAIATFGVLNYGYIAHRYGGDLMPALVGASTIGLPALFDRYRGPRRQRALTGTGLVLVAWSLAANGATAYSLVAHTEEAQTLRNEIDLQRRWSPSGAVDELVARSDTLPNEARADTLQIVGDCAGLFVATGETHEPWKIAGGDTQRGRVDVSSVVGHRRIPLFDFAGSNADRVTVSVEIDAGRYRAVASGQLSRTSDWIALGRATVLEVSVGLDTRMRDWWVLIGSQAATTVETARYDRDWQQQYYAPTARSDDRLVTWLDPHRDELCHSLAGRISQ